MSRPTRAMCDEEANEEGTGEVSSTTQLDCDIYGLGMSDTACVVCPACLAGYETRAATKARAEERASVVAFLRDDADKIHSPHLAQQCDKGDARIRILADDIEAGEHEAKETTDG